MVVKKLPYCQCKVYFFVAVIVYLHLLFVLHLVRNRTQVVELASIATDFAAHVLNNLS